MSGSTCSKFDNGDGVGGDYIGNKHTTVDAAVMLAARMRNIKASPTLTLAAQAKALRAQGKNIIDLAAGEPDFPTPQHVKAAAIAAIHNNFSKYTAVDGVPSLKEAICTKLSAENNLHYEPKQVLVSVGAKHSIYNVMQALLDDGDEVIIPAPYWVSYPDMVLLADGVPVILAADCTHNFKIRPQQLAAAITPRTKMVIINSPSNPSGVAYNAEELRALADVLLQHPRIVIISDDIYEHIFWGQASFTNILNVCPDLYARTIVINGVSKAYAMPGWRIGYAATGQVSVINAMKNVQAQSTSNPASISQVAAEAALRGGVADVKQMTAEFKARHDFIMAALNQVPGFKVRTTDGAFYAFPDVTAAMELCGIKGNGRVAATGAAVGGGVGAAVGIVYGGTNGGDVDDVAFAALLLKEAEVAVVPGSAFGAPGYLRFSYTASIATLGEAVKRIAAVINNYRQQAS